MQSQSRIIVLLSAVFCLARGCFGQAPNTCFAFLLNGDVAVNCGGQMKQVTHRGDLEGFAVSDEHGSLAYTTSRTVARTVSTESVVSTTVLIDLKTGGSRRVEGVSDIVSSCGGLFPLDTLRTGAVAHDLITGEELVFQPYVRFRCSYDKRTVVGVSKALGGDLYGGLPPITRIASAGSFNVRGFAVSSDGSKIVYRSDRGSICLFSAPGVAQCAEKQGTIADSPSVNDSGEVLIAAGTGRECFYSSPYSFSPAQFPGAKDENRDECLGIAYWRQGVKSLQIIEPVGRHPQWVSPETADSLRKLGQMGGQMGQPELRH
jgi:hypothetical protein